MIKEFGEWDNDYFDKLTKIVETSLKKAGDVAVTETKKGTPVDTGVLRNGWYKDKKDNDTYFIGNGVDYAIDVEYGSRGHRGSHMLRSGMKKGQDKLKQEINKGIKEL